MYLSVTDPAGERTQRCIGPTPFASARHTTVSLPTALRPYDNEDEKEDDDATFPTALTYPYTLRGASVAYGDERVRRPRDRTETEWAGEGGDLAPALRDLCVIPDARWQHPPPLADVPIAPDGKGLLPRDTLHPRISEMQAQENAKAVFYAPHVGLLANASRKKPPCPSYGALPPGGSASLNLTCAYASFDNDAVAMAPLGLVCGATSSGPYYTFPVTSFVDFLSTPSIFTCPFPSATFATVAYNRYDTPVTVSSVAQGYIGTSQQMESASPVTNRAVRAAAWPSVCGGQYNATIGGGRSAMVMFWLSAGQTFQMNCFGVYSNIPSDIEVALACASTSDFSKTVVPLTPLPQWGPTLGFTVSCPFSGYFGIIIRNRAQGTTQFGYFATGSVLAGSESFAAHRPSVSLQ